MKDNKIHLTWILMVGWICILGVFGFEMERDTQRNERRLAMTTANSFFQQVLVSRSWNASHRGVYVPISLTTQPNEYLPLLDRDLTTDNGVKLTKINPSYMTRQMSELAKKMAHGIQFHITSLKPIRPENKATKWEEKWLNSFEQGIKEQGEFFVDNGTTWFRYMAPLITEPECLNCHAQQGYKEGDIRGGLSVSLPYPTPAHTGIFVGYGLVAAIGLLFIFTCGTIYERRRRLFNATFNNPIPTCITDKNHTILMANESYWIAFGAAPHQKKMIKCHEHRPGESCRTAHCPLTKIMEGSSQYSYEAVKTISGGSRHFIITSRPLLSSRGKVMGVVESFQDITRRKQMEKELEKSNRRLESLCITDALTGIANRRCFDKILAQEYARHTRSETELSLIMLDIDYFKLFNDCYGHVNGDECLRKIAKVIANCTARPADLAARYGGEEFVCVLPETGKFGALAIAEKIRREIAEQNIPHKESEIADYVTASLGVVTVQCTTAGSAKNIIEQADELLYKAKESGRNRVEHFPIPDMEENIKGDMVQLTWKDAFCCGNHLIDSQHQSLFQVSNELLKAVLSARPPAEIAAIVAKMLADATQHFHDEEVLLKNIDFPDIEQHAKEHATLLAKGFKLSQAFEASTLTVGEIFQFLANEVVALHILGTDRKYFPFINKGSEVDPNTVKDG